MNRALIVALSWIVLVGFTGASAKDKTDSIIISGWLAEVDPSAHTFAIRNGKKLLQFTINPSRTNIQVDDWGSFQTSLNSVRVGAAAVVQLSVADGRPTVESVKFTHHPATAIPVKTRPGFVFSPYSHTVFDVRKCAHGDMVEDVWPGKIFLVP